MLNVKCLCLEMYCYFLGKIKPWHDVTHSSIRQNKVNLLLDTLKAKQNVGNILIPDKSRKTSQLHLNMSKAATDIENKIYSRCRSLKAYQGCFGFRVLQQLLHCNRNNGHRFSNSNSNNIKRVEISRSKSDTSTSVITSRSHGIGISVQSSTKAHISLGYMPSYSHFSIYDACNNNPQPRRHDIHSHATHHTISSTSTVGEEKRVIITIESISDESDVSVEIIENPNISYGYKKRLFQTGKSEEEEGMVSLLQTQQSLHHIVSLSLQTSLLNALNPYLKNGDVLQDIHELTLK